MTQFAEVVEQDTPRLAVMMSMAANGDEQFQWGIVGKIPLLSLVGAVSGLISKLSRGEFVEECPQLAVVIAKAVVVAKTDDDFEFFAHPEMYRESVVGMLELVKNVLVDSQRAKQVANQQIIIPGR